MKKIITILSMVFMSSIVFAQQERGNATDPDDFYRSIGNPYNLHEIDPGNFYRSAQMPATVLESTAKKLDIKTVINLRGESNDSWYKEEAEVADRLGMLLVNIKMSAKTIPSKENLATLIKALETAPRPILVHCKAGVDRTGEAAAIYQMIFMEKEPKDALKMLTFNYLHLGKFKFPAKRYFIGEVWKGRDWALTEYDPCTDDYKYFNKNSVQCNVKEPLLNNDNDNDE